MPQPKPTLEDQFFVALEEVENNCRLARVTLADVCATHGISRANVSRWKRRVPATIRVMTALQVESRQRLLEREALLKEKQAAARRSETDLIKRTKATAAEILRNARKGD